MVFVVDEVERVGAASDVDVGVKLPLQRRQAADDVDDQTSAHRRLVAVAAERVPAQLELVLGGLRGEEIRRFASRFLVQKQKSSIFSSFVMSAKTSLMDRRISHN